GEVVGPTEASDRVEQHHHVVSHLDKPLGPLDGQFRHRGVVRRRTVECGGDDLALHRPLHVGDLFGALVHQHHHEVALGVVRGDRVGDVLHDRRLARLGRGDDQGTLSLTHRHHQVDDPGGEFVRRGLQTQPFIGVQRRQLVELGTLLRHFGVEPVDRVHPHERVELLPLLLALARLLHHTRDGVAAAQSVLTHQRQRDVHVVRARQISGRPHERVVLQHVEDARDGQQDVVLPDLGLGATAALAPTPATTVPEAPAPSAAAFLVVLTAVVVLGPSRAALATLLATAALAVLAVAFGTLTRRIVVLLRSSRLRRALRTSASAGSAPTTPGRPAALVLSVGRRRLALLAGVLGARLSGARLVGLRAAHSGLLRSSVRTPFGVILFGFLLGLTTLGLGFAHAVERKRRFFGGHTSRAGGAAALRGRPRPLRLALALTNGGDEVTFA